MSSLGTFRHFGIGFHAANGIWSFNIFYALYLLFTVSSVGKFLPMSSNEYKKGFIQVYLFFFICQWGGGGVGWRADFFHITRENELLSVFRYRRHLQDSCHRSESACGK